MIAAIMQPTYLPWVGYFDLMDRVDVFVFHIDVQFDKQSWQQRNRIRTAKGLEWLTVPVYTKGRSGQQIMDVELVDPIEYARRHTSKIRQAYQRAPFFADYAQDLFMCLEEGAGTGRLSQLNISLIRYLVEALGVDSELRSSTDFSVSRSRTQRLADLSVAVGTHTYMSPFGSIEYIAAEPEPFADADISLVFQNFEHPQYNQLHEPFQSHASVLDLLFMRGPDALEVIRSGRRAPMSLEEALALHRQENGANDA